MMRFAPLSLLIILLVVSSNQVYAIPSHLRVRLVILTIDGKMFTYRNLTPDSLIEAEIQPSREVQISIVIEAREGEVFRIYSGLLCPLYTSKGSSIVEESNNTATFVVSAQKSVIQVYGTSNDETSTILLIFLSDWTPLLIIRSKSSQKTPPEKEALETEEEILKLKRRISEADIPVSRKKYYNNLVLRAKIARTEGRHVEALKVLVNASSELENEKLKSREVKILIEDARTTLDNNRARLSHARISEVEVKIELAYLKWEAGDYKEAKKLAIEAKELATWTLFDEIKRILAEGFIILIIIVALVLAIVAWHFHRRRSRISQPASERSWEKVYE